MRGGLAFIIKDQIRYTVKKDLNCWIEGKIETFSIEIEVSEKKKLLVCLVYRPPSANPEDVLHDFGKFLSDTAAT